MSVERCRLPIAPALPPRKRRVSADSLRVLLMMLVGEFAFLLGAGVLAGPPRPEALWFGSLMWWAVSACIIGLILTYFGWNGAIYPQGVVSYVRDAQNLVIRTPRVRKAIIGSLFVVSNVVFGACSVVALCWAISVGAELRRSWWSGMVTTSLFLPVSLYIARHVCRFAFRSPGITLAPTGISGRTEGGHLEETDWGAVSAVSAVRTEAARRLPAYTSVRIETARAAFTASSMAFDSDPHGVTSVIEFFRQHPEHRNALQDPRAALELVRNAMLSGWRGAEAAA